MTSKEFFKKLIVHLEIGRVGGKGRLVAHDNLEDDENVLWTLIMEQRSFLIAQRKWDMSRSMTPAKVEELRDVMLQAFRKQMRAEVERSDYESLKDTKAALAAWQEGFADLNKQYSLA